jgi:hypothetical protein
MSMVLETSGDEPRTFPVTPEIFHFDGSLIEVYRGTPYSYYLSALKSRAAQISRDVFNIESVDAAQEITSNMKGGSIFFVRPQDADPKDDLSYVGYSTQRIMEVSSESGSMARVLYFSTRALKEEYQHRRLGRFFLQLGNSVHRPEILALRTQSPASVLSFKKSGLVDNVFPIDGTYERSPFMQSMLEQVALRTRHPEPVDLTTGLARRVYPEGRNRAYLANPNNTEANAIYDQMVNGLGLDPDSGDAIYLMGRVKGRPY